MWHTLLSWEAIRLALEAQVPALDDLRHPGSRRCLSCPGAAAFRPELPPTSLSPEEERLRLLTRSPGPGRFGGRSRGCCLFDDLQWADPSTLQLFHYLARQVRRHPLLLVGAYDTPR